MSSFVFYFIQDLNINIISINSTALDVSRPLNHVVECECRECDREKLLNQLKTCATHIMEYKGHYRTDVLIIVIVYTFNFLCNSEFQLNTELNESERNDYFSVEFTLRNEVGSLVSALKVFQVCW